MARVRFSLSVALMLGISGVVWADMSASPWSAGPDARFAESSCRSDLKPSRCLHETPSAAVDPTRLALPEDLSGREDAKSLPPAPNSASLFLCAMGTLGAFQLTRSAKKLHAGAVPTWLHTGGPQQIGHRFALDWGLLDILPLCRFGPPIKEHTSSSCVYGGRPIQFDRQQALTEVIPRGPPRLSPTGT